MGRTVVILNRAVRVGKEWFLDPILVCMCVCVCVCIGFPHQQAMLRTPAGCARI